MNPLVPLRFRPLFRRYLWGGRRLGTLLGKPIGDGADYAESWELVDHGEDQSVVVAGPDAGATLGDLLASRAEPLVGRGVERLPRVAVSGGCAMRPQFPLLVKFLDAHRDLSVQVHPDDHQAARQMPPDLGKTEAWVVLHREPGAKVYAGLQAGVDRSAVEKALELGTIESCLHSFEPHVGDCIFIPAGTVHALGAGLVVAEIQQSSDTTFRLFDWNRVGPDGQPRKLHVRESLDVIDFARGPVSPSVASKTTDAGRERLVVCDKFILDRRRYAEPAAVQVGGDGGCRLLVVTSGELRVAGDPTGEGLRFGETMLVPAAAGAVRVDVPAGAEWLEVSLPT